MTGRDTNNQTAMPNTQVAEELLKHLCDCSVTQDVVRTRGLLDPKRLKLGQSGHPTDRLGDIPPLVGIDHLT